MARKVYYFDMDGVLCNFHKEAYSYANAINQKWIANLDPFMENVEVVRNLLKAGKSVYIISKAASESAKQGKIEWLAKYIPELPERRIIVIVGSGKKPDYMKTKTGILVDDDIKNIRQWAKTGRPVYHVEIKGQTVIL